MTTAGNSGFYETVPSMGAVVDAFDPAFFVPVPDDWYVAVSDIQGSMAAVAQGRHSDINFCAAAMIAGLSNYCGSIPYQFGGDGGDGGDGGYTKAATQMKAQIKAAG